MPQPSQYSLITNDESGPASPYQRCNHLLRIRKQARLEQRVEHRSTPPWLTGYQRAGISPSRSPRRQSYKRCTRVIVPIKRYRNCLILPRELETRSSVRDKATICPTQQHTGTASSRRQKLPGFRVPRGLIVRRWTKTNATESAGIKVAQYPCVKETMHNSKQLKFLSDEATLSFRHRLYVFHRNNGAIKQADT